MFKFICSVFVVGSTLLGSMAFGVNSFDYQLQTQAIGQVVKNTDGTIPYFTSHGVSTLYPNPCKSIPGTHLPTARELATILVSFGAKGVLETNEVSNGIPSGYYYTEGLNPVVSNGKFSYDSDSFYFNAAGYQPSNSSFGSNSVWTSSTSTHQGLVYFNAHEGMFKDGNFWDIDPPPSAAIFCVFN